MRLNSIYRLNNLGPLYLQQCFKYIFRTTQFVQKLKKNICIRIILDQLVIANFYFGRTCNLRYKSNFKQYFWFVDVKNFIFGLFQNYVSILVEQQEYDFVPVKVSFLPTICRIAQHVEIPTQFSGRKTCIKSISRDAKLSVEKKLSFGW